MATTQDNTSSQGLLEQQRVLAAFGEIALGAEDLSALLTEACRLVGQALKTDLAKVVELTPEGKTMLVRAGVGWKPGVINEVLVSADEGTPEGLTLKEGAVISPDINRVEREPPEWQWGPDSPGPPTQEKADEQTNSELGISSPWAA